MAPAFRGQVPGPAYPVGWGARRGVATGAGAVPAAPVPASASSEETQGEGAAQGLAMWEPAIVRSAGLTDRSVGRCPLGVAAVLQSESAAWHGDGTNCT